MSDSDACETWKREARMGRQKNKWLLWVLSGALLCLAFAAGLPAKDADLVAGKRLFRSAEISETGLMCWHCHADFNEKKTPDSYVRPGHPMYNVGHKSKYRRWDGAPLQTIDDAIASCMIRWMTKRKPASYDGEPAQKHHVRQLVAYLQSEELSPEQKSKPLEPIVDDKMPSDRMLSLGDASFGGVVFRQSCGICHKTEGTGPAPSLIRNGYSRYQIAKKVRGLDEKGLNGLRMPLFSKDRLSDRQLLNVVAYVYQL
ncbi:MAG: hypothetical protein CME19_12675 [Gemmatimonadetes bacterium]|nr:hypothetical protein [Gemmatimonadota bacterium]